MKVLLNFHLARDVRMSVPDSVLERLRTEFPGHDFIAADDEEALARGATSAEVFYGWRFPLELLPSAPALRWIQSASAGVEGMLRPEFIERGIALTNGAGIASNAIAEHAVAVMLAFGRNLHVALKLQAEARWDRPAVMAGAGSLLRELRGSRVAVLGLGPIGRTISEDVAALGATVRGLRRHPPVAAQAPFEAIVGPAGLDDLLAWGDFVVLAVPHTPETDRMIGRRELGLMRPEAYLINIARGSVVDEGALVEVLERGGLAGAGLDVFSEEPLPITSPLWRLPNVILTPHVAGATLHYLERALGIFVDNFHRYLDGRPLRNLVDPALGYPRT